MGWFTRRKPTGARGGPDALIDGEHRSPGLAALCQEMREHPPRAILDLGPPSTENLGFLSGFSENVTIQDLFRSSEGSFRDASVVRTATGQPAGVWAACYRFDPEAAALPDDELRFDAVLAWDLLHYFERPAAIRFVERLARRCRPGGLVLLIASSTAPVPSTPIQFKIASAGTVEYILGEGERSSPPMLNPREVEKLMVGFRPLRLFQLRNGFQELLFVREEAADPAVEPDPSPPDVAPAEDAATATSEPASVDRDSATVEAETKARRSAAGTGKNRRGRRR